MPSRRAGSSTKRSRDAALIPSRPALSQSDSLAARISSCRDSSPAAMLASASFLASAERVASPVAAVRALLPMAWRSTASACILFTLPVCRSSLEAHHVAAVNDLVPVLVAQQPFHFAQTAGP